MNLGAAVKESRFGLAWRDQAEGKMEVYDEESGGFFFLEFNATNSETRNDASQWVINRRPGRGTLRKDDWGPCTNNTLQSMIEQWKAKQEGRDVTIISPWEKAIELSPVKRAIRQTPDFKEMIRDEFKNTWLVVAGGMLTRVAGPFKKFDGWEPMEETHRFAQLDLTVNHSYRLENTSSDAKKAYRNPEAKLAPVLPETITACQETMKTLKDTLTLVKDPSLQKEIVNEMLALSKSISWHLREDRYRY